MKFEITVDSSPGDNANVFWSNQFDFTGASTGGYTGMQSNGDYDENMFLFSVWDTTEAKPGTEGSFCVPFGGEGEGMSCRMRHNWRTGDRYQFELKSESDGWFSVTVSNLDDPHVEFVLGTIRTSANASTVSPYGMVSWTEYFEHGATCTNQPFAKASFALPMATPSTSTRVNATNVTEGCGTANSVTVTHAGSTQETGIGFPAKGGSAKQPAAKATAPETEIVTPPTTAPPRSPKKKNNDRETGTISDPEKTPVSSESAPKPTNDPQPSPHASPTADTRNHSATGTESAEWEASPATSETEETDLTDGDTHDMDIALDHTPKRAPGEPTASSEFYATASHSQERAASDESFIGTIAGGAGVVALSLALLGGGLMVHRRSVAQKKH